MKRVYVAGPYNASNGIDLLNNVRRGMRAGTQVLLMGYAPFVPFFDFHFQLMLRTAEKLTIEKYHEYSLAWLVASDCVLVLPNSTNSLGVQREIAEAQARKIPVYYSFEELKENEES